MNNQPIILKNLLDLAQSNPAAFNALPELSFVLPLAVQIKAKGCTCGLGEDINQATKQFNQVVSDLNPEQQHRFKHFLGTETLAFGIMTPESFTVKTY